MCNRRNIHMIFICISLAVVFSPSNQKARDSCDADSPNTKCKENISRMVAKGAGDMQLEHWRQWYWSIDTNHDGTVSGEDRNTAIKRHLEAYNLDHDSPAALGMAKWWNECALLGREGPLTPDEFVDMHNEQYIRLGGDKYRNNFKQCFLDIFNACDSNGDGFYTTEEYMQIYKNYGHKMLAEDHTSFEGYKPQGGKIPVETLASSWSDYFTVINKDHTIEDIISVDGWN